jgi:hypothetical protein
MLIDVLLELAKEIKANQRKIGRPDLAERIAELRIDSPAVVEHDLAARLTACRLVT